MKTLFILLAMVFSSTVSAAIIEISTDSVEVSSGDNITVDINIFDAVQFDFLTFEFTFDNTLLTYNGETDSALGFFADDIDATTTGALYLSLDGFFDSVIYEGSFLIASLSFSAVNNGIANFAATFSEFDAFEFEFVSVGTPEIRTASVDAPSVSIALVLMLAGLLLIRRKTHSY